MTNRSVEGLKDALESLRKAMMSGNRAALESVTTDDLSYWHASGRAESRKEFIDALATKGGFADIVITSQSVKVMGDVGIVEQAMKRTNAAGKVGGMRELAVWVYQGDAWKMMTRQSAKLAE